MYFTEELVTGDSALVRAWRSPGQEHFVGGDRRLGRGPTPKVCSNIHSIDPCAKLKEWP